MTRQEPPYESSTPPRITVIIPTCNRSSDLARTLASLVHVTYPCWDILVIDQSDDDQSVAVVEVARLTLSAPLRYCRDLRKGLSRARNLALSLVDADILAFLDDDCTIEATWIEKIAATFADHPNAAIVCASVDPGPHDWRTQMIPYVVFDRETVKRGRWGYLDGPNGMGAGLYLRLSAVHRIGPFDEGLGPGAPGQNCDDWDYIYRALARNLPVVTTPHVRVTHRGARSYADGAASRAVRANGVGLGALHVKILRCADLFGVVLVAAQVWQWLCGVNLQALVTRSGPANVSWLVAYPRGIATGLRLRLDRGRCVYRL